MAARAPVRTARTVVKQVAEKAVKKEKTELETVRAEIEKRFGTGIVTSASETKQFYRIPTGIFWLDMATCGGLPFNQVTMFHGKRSSGKSSTAAKCIAQAQIALPGQTPALLDIEHTYDASWGGKLGVDNENLLHVNPETGEDAIDQADALVRTKEISLVVVDSIAALVSNKEVEESAEDNATPGLQAKLVTRFCRRITNALYAERRRGHFVTLLLLNQHRTAIGKWAPHGQTALSLPGGNALEHTTMLQVEFKNKENMTKSDIGMEVSDFNEHAFKIDKCKMNGGLRSGEFQLMRREHDVYDLHEGEIDDAATMLSYAKRIGAYSGGGRSWTLEFDDFRQTFGNLEETVVFLYENRDVYWLLRCFLIADHARRLNLPDYFVAYLQGTPY